MCIVNSLLTSELELKDYHSWFKGLVGDWIDVAASKCHLEIKRAVISLDEVSLTTCPQLQLMFYRLSLSLTMSGFLNLL